MKPTRRATRLALLGLGAVGLLAVTACSSPDMEKLGREEAERAKASIQSVDAKAHDQKVDPDVVKRVQQELTTLKEYMGPVNGKLDPVTLNAFEAFQRSQGIRADGMFEPSTLQKLTAAAAQRQAKNG